MQGRAVRPRRFISVYEVGVKCKGVGITVLKYAAMSDLEHGFKWWMRYVVVPVIGGGGVVAIIVAFMGGGALKQRPEPSSSTDLSPTKSQLVNPTDSKNPSVPGQQPSAVVIPPLASVKSKVPDEPNGSPQPVSGNNSASKQVDLSNEPGAASHGVEFYMYLVSANNSFPKSLIPGTTASVQFAGWVEVHWKVNPVIVRSPVYLRTKYSYVKDAIMTPVSYEGSEPLGVIGWIHLALVEVFPDGKELDLATLEVDCVGGDVCHSFERH
jgi:hypothetical protein